MLTFQMPLVYILCLIMHKNVHICNKELFVYGDFTVYEHEWKEQQREKKCKVHVCSLLKEISVRWIIT